MNQSNLDATQLQGLILAGGELEESLKPYESVATKGLLTFGTNKTQLQRVLDAMMGLGMEKVAVVASKAIPEEVKRIPGVLWIEDKGSLLENVLAGLEALSSPLVLISTVDLPFLKTEDLQGFLKDCGQKPATVWVSMLSKEVIEAEFPGAKRTFVKLVEGPHTSGNVFLVDRLALGRQAPLLRDLIALRKKPLRLAMRVGLSVLFKLIFGRLSVSGIERVARKLTGADVLAVSSKSASLGMDVDKPADFEIVRDKLIKNG